MSDARQGMRPAGRIEPQPWMTAATTRRLLTALTADGAEVRFVGGCVRDAVIGRPVKDVDIATRDPPETVIGLLERAGLKAVPTGVAHGTVTAVVGGQPFEVTTLRLDVETDGRRARVAFTDDWAADAARRDFTFNALSCRSDGTLYDPFDGVADLRAGVVRFVGDPRQRIREDVLRLLRFFRFFAYYGNPPPHRESLAACAELASLLPTLSAERVRAELLRLLAAPAPQEVLALMAEVGVLGYILPEATRIDRLARLVEIDRTADPLLRLAAVTELDKAGVRALARRLRLSNAERDRLVRAVGPADLGDVPPGHRKAIHRVGLEAYRDRARLAWAESLALDAQADPEPHLARLRSAATWRPRVLPVGGPDVIALGLPKGPDVGRLLAAVEDWWVDHDFRPDREACLAKLRALAGR